MNIQYIRIYNSETSISAINMCTELESAPKNQTKWAKKKVTRDKNT